MLAHDFVPKLRDAGWDLVALPRSEFDIADPVSAARILEGEFGKLDWVVNLAAYTGVDKAESEPQLAFEANTLGPGYLARAAQTSGARFLHISTDFVFDGTARSPIPEDAPTAPLGVYGQSKRQGELAVLDAAPDAVIVRTAWLYGPHGRSFPRTMIELYLAGRELRVVADQVGCPTYTADLADTLVAVLVKNAPGAIYHATGPEAMSWHAFATLAIEVATGSRPELSAIGTEEYPTPAKRPAYSVLDCTGLARCGIGPMRPVREALTEFVSRRKEIA